MKLNKVVVDFLSIVIEFCFDSDKKFCAKATLCYLKAAAFSLVAAKFYRRKFFWGLEAVSKNPHFTR